MSLTPSRPRQPATFTEWLKLFAIYASVYSEKYPAASPQLFTYILRILSMSSRKPVSYAWRAYDERFRQVKAYNPSAAWHLVNETLWRDAEEASHNFRDSHTSNPSNTGHGPKFNRFNRRNTPKQATGRKTYCRDYNQADKHCTREQCKFSHSCSKCDKNHPAFKCPSPAAADASRT